MASSASFCVQERSLWLVRLILWVLTCRNAPISKRTLCHVCPLLSDFCTSASAEAMVPVPLDRVSQALSSRSRFNGLVPMLGQIEILCSITVCRRPFLLAFHGMR